MHFFLGYRHPQYCHLINLHKTRLSLCLIFVTFFHEFASKLYTLIIDDHRYVDFRIFPLSKLFFNDMPCVTHAFKNSF